LPEARRAGGDRSNGYDAFAAEFMARRERSSIGVASILTWARSLPAGASILDLGCGSGTPVAEALAGDGFAVFGVDASPRMVAAFRQRLPHAVAACEAVEESKFFDRTFDGVIAVGLIFLLAEREQRALIAAVARVLKPGGLFLFTSPVEPCTWTDILTGGQSLSLGAGAYEEVAAAAGLVVVGGHDDEGNNHYHEMAKPALHPS
jgi:SAM-dependent methyltransferase